MENRRPSGRSRRFAVPLRWRGSQIRPGGVTVGAGRGATGACDAGRRRKWGSLHPQGGQSALISRVLDIPLRGLWVAVSRLGTCTNLSRNSWRMKGVCSSGSCAGWGSGRAGEVCHQTRNRCHRRRKHRGSGENRCRALAKMWVLRGGRHIRLLPRVAPRFRLLARGWDSSVE